MRTLNPCVKPAPARLALLLILGLLLGQLGGCTIFRPAPLALPAGFAANPQALALANPQTRQAAYKALFPELKTLQTGGSMVAASIWRRGKEPFDFSYYARNDAGLTEHLLRMRGYIPMTTLFDIVVRGRQALVVLHPAKVTFEGEIPAEGSPFADRFGVEPWDLVPMMAIGQQIAQGAFEADRGHWTTTLTPRQREVGAGLRRIVLDNRSGLPRRAEWRLGAKTYETEYEGWEFFKDSETQVSRLMPTAIRIHRLGAALRLTLRSYRFDRVPDAALFDISAKRLADEKGYATQPLSKLKNIL